MDALTFLNTVGFSGENVAVSGSSLSGTEIFSDTFTTGVSQSLRLYSANWAGDDVAADWWDINQATDQVNSNQTSGIEAEYAGSVLSDDYYAEVVGANTTATAGSSFGAMCRLDSVGNAANGYLMRIIHDTGTWQLDRDDLGVTTTLASGTVTGYAVTTVYTVRISCEGTTIRGYIDGVLMATQTDATYASGKPGMFIRRTAPRITSFASFYL